MKRLNTYLRYWNEISISQSPPFSLCSSIVACPPENAYLLIFVYNKRKRNNRKLVLLSWLALIWSEIHSKISVLIMPHVEYTTVKAYPNLAIYNSKIYPNVKSLTLANHCKGDCLSIVKHLMNLHVSYDYIG